jgi:LytR cell envelope-related transcriptional attenuator
MNPDPRVRRGAHRTTRAVGATVLPSLLAILAVTALVTALYGWRGEDAKPPSAVAAPAPEPTTSVATVSAKAAARKSDEPVVSSRSAAAKTSSAAKKSRAAAAKKSRAAAAKKRRAAADKQKAAASARLRSDLAVVVLNETSRSGLAAAVADRLRGNGWTVSGVGNFRGAVPATTVYYPAGHAAAAQAAANSLPTPPRVLPRFGNLSTSRLTVIVTTNYPS